MPSSLPPRQIRVALRRSILFGLLGLLLFTGCLPYSCRREANEALFPSDSLSRTVAAQTPVDTLESEVALTGSENHPLAYPRTVRFLEDGGVVASDAKRNSLFYFGRDGSFRREQTDSVFAVPYLIGSRCDTLVVFSAETDRVNFVTGDGPQPERAVAINRPAPETLVYMLAAHNNLYAKIVGQNTGASLLRLDETGQPAAKIELGGTYWRHAGFLRTWGDSLLSLSGFRPVVRRLPADFSSATPPDSLSLVGFDSPMLERSYAYAQDDVEKPPLLSASAAPVGDTLFVLNLRPGWVQIDAYDRGGRLLRRLVERHEAGKRDFYPVDLDARRTQAGYRFAVAVRSPEPKIKRFRWHPSDR